MQFSLAAEISRQKSTPSGRSGDLGAIAGLGSRRPALDGAEERHLLERRRCPPCGTSEAEQAEVVRRGPSYGDQSSRPSARASSGMSFWTSCSWRFLVPVETTTRRPSSTAGSR